MKRILIVAALLAGCAKAPESTQQVNKEFNVDTLFTKDGCTVYRFADGGVHRYFTNCHGSVAWNENQQVGKTHTTDPVEVQGGAQ
jgi:hypothetical protein